VKASAFKNLAKPLSAEKKAALQAEREALALYEEQLTRMCWRKFGYPSEARAAKGIARAARRNPSVPLRAYKCPACPYWHLTSALLA
jgi:hypothetical protein